MKQPNVKEAFDRHRLRQQALDLAAALHRLQTMIQALREHFLSALASNTWDRSLIPQWRQPALKALQEIQTQRARFIAEEEWQMLGAEWFSLQQSHNNPDPQTCFEQHNRLIRCLLNLEAQLLNSHAFSHLDDAALAQCRLMLKELPELLEALSQIDSIIQFERLGRQQASQSEWNSHKEHLERYLGQASRHLAYAYSTESPVCASSNNTTQKDEKQNSEAVNRPRIRHRIETGLSRLREITEPELAQWLSGSAVG